MITGFRNLFALACCIGFCADTSYGQALVWRTTTVSATLAPGQDKGEATFGFTNLEKSPVRILSVSSGCSCTQVEADKAVYASGESGRIHARFNRPENDGLQITSITVVTQGTGKDTAYLTLRANALSYLHITPQFVYWLKSQDPTEKTIECSRGSPTPVTVVAAHPVNDTVSVRIETIVPGEHYRLHLRPVSTRVPFTTAIAITDQAGGKPQPASFIYAAVK